MAKKAYVYSGTDWVPLASEVTDLTAYSTSTEIANTYATKADNGLVHINTTSLSAATAHQVNSLFSSTYTNYLVALVLKANSGGTNVDIRLSASGTPSSTSYYHNLIRMQYSGASVNGQSATNTSYFRIHNDLGTNQASASFYLGSPFVSEKSSFTTMMNGVSETNQGISMSGGYHNQALSYDGLYIFTGGANTISGTLSVYGLKV